MPYAAAYCFAPCIPHWQGYDEPLTWTHFKAEGDIEFKTVLYIPTNTPLNFYDKYYEKEAQTSLKLYVRRVFISDAVAELLPRWVWAVG